MNDIIKRMDPIQARNHLAAQAAVKRIAEQQHQERLRQALAALTGKEAPR